MLYYIYKIVCDDLPNFNYVGSTQSVKHRKYQHKSCCNNEKQSAYNFKLYKTIRENGGWSNWRMVCIAQVEVESKRQAEIIEEEYRMKLEANLNGQRCYTTEEQRKEQHKEYRENNAEKMKEYHKEYRENNAEKIRECNKEYRENNAEKIRECNKEYRENNTEKIRECNKEYRENNTEKIKEWVKTKCNCECGGRYTNAHKSQHFKSIKHQKYLNENKDL